MVEFVMTPGSIDQAYFDMNEILECTSEVEESHFKFKWVIDIINA